MFRNKRAWTLFALATLGSTGFAQVPSPGATEVPAVQPAVAPAPWAISDAGTPAYSLGESAAPDPLKGNQKFQNFIGFMSNPLQSIDPRALTESYPIFASYHTSTLPALPSVDMQLYGAGITVALSDRFAIGLNQGGYAQVSVNKNQPGLFPDRLGILRDRRDSSGQRQGWLDFGGFAQYTLIENVPEQFLLTGGLRWVSPSGAHQLFQGNPPWQLAPYVTAGKEIGCFHILADVGYNFAAGSAQNSFDNLYVNLHLDRQCFGWLYPLIELNTSFPTANVSVDLPSRRGFFDFGNFSATGSIAQLAMGANAVIVPNKVELGAVYTTTVASQRNFNVDGLIVRMTLRY